MARTTAVSITTSSLSLAQEIESIWLNLINPAPDALSLFEVPPDATWRIDAYYTPAPDIDELHSALQSVVGREVPRPELQPVPDRNWVAISQSALPPVHAGRFTIHGSHDRRRIASGPNAVEIDAGEAFGTAHHATTFGCLEAITRLAHNRNFNKLLDLGTGSGVLAIAAARAWPHAQIFASDNDQDAIKVAKRNSTKNLTRRRINFIVAAGLAQPTLRQNAPYDLIIANILAGPLIELAPHIAKATSRKGIVILSGLLADQAREVTAAYVAQGLALSRNNRVFGWSTLEFRNSAL